MTDNGVRISNREIYDAVLEVSAKLDQHITEHKIKDSLKVEKVSSARHRITTWVASAAAFMAGATAVVEFIK